MPVEGLVSSNSVFFPFRFILRLDCLHYYASTVEISEKLLWFPCLGFKVGAKMVTCVRCRSMEWMCLELSKLANLPKIMCLIMDQL